jgi:hypothetical protein
MKQIDTSSQREATIRHWAGFVHARSEHDIKRVHAFQQLMREHEDLTAVSDDQVSQAYGGRGWVPVPVCYECGARNDYNVQFGAAHDVALCGPCLSAACALSFGVPQAAPAQPAPAKPSIFTRLFKGA